MAGERPAVTFSEAVLVRIEHGDLERVDALADRLRLPLAAVVAQLVRVGLEAVKRDPPLLMGEVT